MQVCRTFQHFRHGLNDLSLFAHAVSGPLAFRYDPSHVRPAPCVPRAGMSCSSPAMSMRFSLASVGWLRDEPGRVVPAAVAEVPLSYTYTPAAPLPDGSFVLPEREQARTCRQLEGVVGAHDF